MPHLKRRIRTRKQPQYDFSTWQAFLTTGRLFGDGVGGEGVFAEVIENGGGDSPNFRAMGAGAWAQLRSQILPNFIREHPGTRPFGWWEFDAPSYRIQLNDVGSIDDRHAGTIYARGGFGIPRLYLHPGDQPIFESQVDFLRRIGELTKQETELCQG